MYVWLLSLFTLLGAAMPFSAAKLAILSDKAEGLFLIFCPFRGNGVGVFEVISCSLPQVLSLFTMPSEQLITHQVVSCSLQGCSVNHLETPFPTEYLLPQSRRLIPRFPKQVVLLREISYFVGENKLFC